MAHINTKENHAMALNATNNYIILNQFNNLENNIFLNKIDSLE
jgi:hypothetical protein